MSSKNKPRDDDDDGGDDEDIHIEDPEKLSAGPKVPHILLKEGFLQKKSPKGILKVWQSRYFRLYTDGLQYFKAKKDPQPAGTIPLFSITEVGIPDKHKKKGDRFDVTVGDKKGGRTFALVASSKEECKKWVDLLQKLLKDRDDAMKEASGGSAAVSLNVKTDGKIWKDQGKAENLNAKAQNRAIANAMAGVRPGDSAPKTENKGPVSVDLGNVKLTREESVGPIGVVYIAQDKKSTSASLGLPQQQYLVHAVKRNDPDFKVADQLFKDMRMLNSPYIIKQLTSGDSDDYQFVFYSPPFTSDDALVAYLEKHRRLPEDVVRHFAAQLSLALGYLHGKGLNYPALNPDTVYINADGNAVLGDILCALPSDKIPDDALLPEYTTPERIETQYADWWRLGVLLYEMSVGIPPFRSKAENKEEDIAKQVAGFQPDKLRFPPFVPAQLQDFIRRLLNPDPKKRLGAAGTGKDIEDIKQHEFMAGEISWSDYMHERGTPPEKCPGWVRKNVLENPKTEEHVKSLRSMPVKHVSRVNLQLFAARNLPGAKSTVAVVRCEDKTQSTPAKDGASPEWNEKYKFDVHYLEGELGIDLNHASGNPLGHVTIALQDIKSQYPNPVDVWLPIYDSNAMASGELHVCYTWEEQRVDLPMPTYVKVELEKKFFDNFGQPASSAGKTRSASGVKKASIIAAPKKEDEKKKDEVKKEEPAPKKEDPKPKAEAKKAAAKAEDDDDGDAPPPPPAPEEDDDKKKQANGQKHKNSDAGDSSDDEKGDKGARGRSDSNDSDDGDSDKQWQEIQRMEAEKAKKAEEERKKREEEEEKRLAEEEARRKLEDEETERMLREEEERRRRDAEEAEKMRMEAEEIRRMEAEASGGDTAKPSGPSAAEKAAAEEAAKAAAQAAARAAAEAAAQAAEEARAAAREEQKRLLEAERAKFQAERDALAAARREFEELRRQRQIEEEQRRLEEEKRALEEEKRRMEEDIRIAKEREEEDRRIKAEREAAKKLADEKLKLEAERAALENARIAAEKAQIEKARLEAEETARLAAEQKIAAERARMEMELNLAKLAMEKKAAEEIAARIAFERAETARVEREKKEAEEAEKRRKEQEEKDRIAKIEKDSLGPCHTCACNAYKKDPFKKYKCSGCFHEHHMQPAIGFCKDAGCKCVPAEYKPHQFKPNTCAACYHEHHEKSDPHAWHKAHSGPAKPAVAPTSPEPKKAAEPKKVETPKVEAKKPAVSTTPGAGTTAPANQPTTPANRPSVAGTGAAPKAGAPANTPLSPSNAGAKKEAPKVAAAPAASGDAHETHGPCKTAGCTCKDWTKDAFKKNRCATCFHDH